MAANKTWRCDGCGAKNVIAQVTCENCGQARAARAITGKTFDLRCSWVTGVGLRCRLPAAYGPLDKPGFCGWHHDCHTAVLPRSAEEWLAFEEWWLGWYGSKAVLPYCTLETHYPASYLFELICGREPSPVAATACRVGNCPLRILEGPTTPREALKAIHTMFARMDERAVPS